MRRKRQDQDGSRTARSALARIRLLLPLRQIPRQTARSRLRREAPQNRQGVVVPARPCSQEGYGSVGPRHGSILLRPPMPHRSYHRRCNPGALRKGIAGIGQTPAGTFAAPTSPELLALAVPLGTRQHLRARARTRTCGLWTIVMRERRCPYAGARYSASGHRPTDEDRPRQKPR